LRRRISLPGCTACPPPSDAENSQGPSTRRMNKTEAKSSAVQPLLVHSMYLCLWKSDTADRRISNSRRPSCSRFGRLSHLSKYPSLLSMACGSGVLVPECTGIRSHAPWIVETVFPQLGLNVVARRWGWRVRRSALQGFIGRPHEIREECGLFVLPTEKRSKRLDDRRCTCPDMIGNV
jgi:hypothetical protein